MPIKTARTNLLDLLIVSQSGNPCQSIRWHRAILSSEGFNHE